ncbi:hypothetical protein C8R43DRAFT_952190 [Mycena crocata]|nr:hypothetical protein C8R43DRAFT_952190 [Mycena crocata]
MPPRNSRPKPQAHHDSKEEPASDTSTPPAAVNKAKSTRPSHKAKDNAITAAVWNGAAPLGPKKKDHDPEPEAEAEPESEDDPVPRRKWAASSVQQSTKTKASKTIHPKEDSDDNMNGVAAIPMPTKQSHRTRSTQLPVVSVPEDRSADEHQAAPQRTQKSKGKKVAAVTRSSRHSVPEAAPGDDAFGDDEDDGGSVQGQDEEVEQENDDELEGLAPEELRATLAIEVDRYTALINLIYSDSDSDTGSQAMFAALKATHKRAPAPQKPATSKDTSKHSSCQETPAVSHTSWGRTAEPLKAPTKRDLLRQAQDIPSWNAERSASRRHSSHSHVRPQFPLVDDSINIRFNTRNGVGIKDQCRNVERVFSLGIDYNLGFYLITCAYPGLSQRSTFSGDALTRAATDLGLQNIKTRLLLTGRVSTFCGKAKTTAAAVLYGAYQVQHDCAGRVARLTSHQAFIYPHKPDVSNQSKGGTVAHPLPDYKKPYRHEGVAAVMNAFFKGNNSISERVEAMFVRNAAGNLEATQAMVALLCAAIHNTLEDWSSGEHKPTNFDGNRVQDVYNVHILLLEKMKKENPDKYRSLMEDLFTKVSCGSSFTKGSKAATSLLAKEALAMIDFTE